MMRLQSTVQFIKSSWQSDKSYFMVVAAFGIFPALFSSWFVAFFYSSFQVLGSQVSSMAIFYLCTVFTMAFALTPTTFVAVISGYFFGFWGLLGIMLSYPLAAILGLFFGKWVNKWIIGSEFFNHSTLKTFMDKLAERQFFLFFFCRLSPFLPFAMTNVALSRMRLNFGSYIAGTMVGMFPRTLLFFLAGMQTHDIVTFIQHPTTSGIGSLMIPVFIVVSLIGFYFLLRNVIRKMKKELVS